jgi:hypothetical protein
MDFVSIGFLTWQVSLAVVISLGNLLGKMYA